MTTPRDLGALLAFGAESLLGPGPGGIAGSVLSHSGSGYAPGVRPTMVRPMRDVRRMPMAFSVKGLLPGERRRLIARPQVIFRGEELQIPAAFADATVHEIMVGNRVQLLNGAMSAKFFIPGATRVPLTMDTASIAQDVVLEVSRPSGGDFDAIIMGTAAIDGGVAPPGWDDEPEPLVEEAVMAIREEDERYEPGVSLEDLERPPWR